MHGGRYNSGPGSHLRGLVVERRVPPELLPRLRVHVIDLHGGRSVHFSPVASPRGRAPEISDDEGGFRIGQLPRGADSRKLDRQS